MGTILLPAVLYAALHLGGRQYPAPLWGTDQLHYYPVPVLVFFALAGLAGLTLAARPSWARRLDLVLAFQVERFDKKPFTSAWFKTALLLLFFALANTFRVDAHLLGDSSMWFRNLEMSLSGAPHSKITWIRPLPIAGLEYVPAFEALDFLVHLQAYRLGHHLWNWTPQDTYAWLSCVAGVFYLAVLWRIAVHLSAAALERLTAFALLATLGSIQLFFGYGESYTLVTLASAGYALSALKCLQGRSLLYPSLWLLLAIALHTMALFLAPSWIYLLWHRKGRSWAFLLQRPQVYLPLLIAGGAAGLYLYTAFYPSRLPLWTPEEEGKYALLSAPHFGLLANELLLLSPFGILWGIASFRCHRPADPVRALAGWATLGTGAMFLFHDAFLGGRDWDLLAFPALFYTLWGIQGLLSSSGREELLRQVRLVILPLVSLHTALWIGINAHSSYAIDRLGNLLQSTNQSLHYRQFALGYYYLTIRDDARAAVPYFSTAVMHSPPDEQDPQKLRNRYRKYLGYALAATGQYEEATAVLRTAFEIQPTMVGPNDVKAYRSLVLSLLGLGGTYAQQGRQAEAAALWQEAEMRCQELLEHRPDAGWYGLQGAARLSLSNLSGAIDAFRRSVALEQDPDKRYMDYLGLAEALSRTSDTPGAIDALEQALRIKPKKRDEVEKLKRKFSSPPRN